MKKYKHIIWDWNGTLFNDIYLCVDVMNGILRENSLSQITTDHYKSIFTFPVVDYYKLLGFDISEENFKKLSVDFVREYERRKLECTLSENAELVLEEITRKGIKQSILSAYTQDTLEELIRTMNIHKHFENIIGLDNIYAAGKNGIAKRLISKITEAREEILLIGDTEHDFEIAQELEVDSVLISSGHQEKSKLLKTGTPVIDKLSELTKIL